MIEDTIFENLDFDHTINTITKDSFPIDFPLHWHKYVEIAAFPVTSDVIATPLIRINQTSYVLQSGDILLIWPGEIHEIINNTGCELIGLQFPFTLLNDLTDFAHYLNIFRTYHYISHKDMPELAQNMMRYIEHIVLLNKSKRPFYGVETLISLYEMFIAFGMHLSDYTSKETSSLAITSKTLEKINTACSYIIANCEHSLMLKDIADYIGFSPYYFSRIFKKITTYSFVEYLTLQRIKHTEILLTHSNLSITEISYRSGFSSISTFNRVFKQHKGCSPRQFRNYYLEESN